MPLSLAASRIALESCALLYVPCANPGNPLTSFIPQICLKLGRVDGWVQVTRRASLRALASKLEE
eukprot:8442306-Pyramimonas_sp.AAC.1